MFKRFLYPTYLVLILLFYSCKEIYINKEITCINILDTLIIQYTTQLNQISSSEIIEYLCLCEERLCLFQKSKEDEKQIESLKNDIKTYKEIKNNLEDIQNIIMSIEKEFLYSQNQIYSLQQDLIHRHLSKKIFQQYFIQEKKAIQELTNKTNKINKNYFQQIKKIKSLEFKLHDIIIQLNSFKTK